MIDIALIIIIFLLTCISISMICIVVFIRGILFAQHKIMETFFVIQLEHSEMKEYMEKMYLIAYDAGFEKLKIEPRPKNRERGT